jgi:hypothetical protein
MSRSGYSDDIDYGTVNLYRGQVSRAIMGKRGQKLLRDLLAALDAMPEKRLLAHVIDRPEGGLPFAPTEGGVCALGAVGRARGLDLTHLDPEDDEGTLVMADKFDIAECLAREITYVNDEGGYRSETPEGRWQRVRSWVAGQIWEWD